MYGPAVTTLSELPRLARKHSPLLAGSAAQMVADEAAGRT